LSSWIEPFRPISVRGAALPARASARRLGWEPSRQHDGLTLDLGIGPKVLAREGRSRPAAGAPPGSPPPTRSGPDDDSPQGPRPAVRHHPPRGTLIDSNHRLLALWAAACAEHVVHLFESVRPMDLRPRQATEQIRAWTR